MTRWRTVHKRAKRLAQWRTIRMPAYLGTINEHMIFMVDKRIERDIRMIVYDEASDITEEQCRRMTASAPPAPNGQITSASDEIAVKPEGA